jgi:hypothetical protein
MILSMYVRVYDTSLHVTGDPLTRTSAHILTRTFMFTLPHYYILIVMVTYLCT